MVRLGLALACVALVAVALPGRALFVALGAAIAAIGLGISEYGRRELPGRARLGGAAAIALGTLGLALAVTRVAIVLSAIAHVDHLLD